jgi:lambda family phage minor tail protein L
MSALDAAARRLEPGALVKLFVLDLSNEFGPILRFHPYTNLAPNIITFQGVDYSPYPITDEGWDVNTKGTLPRPTVTVSNVGGYASNLLRLYGDFVGCKITRKRTFSQFLDGASEADPTAEFTPEIFTIDRRKTETNTVVQFELSTPFDAQGILIPRRQIIANFCQWLYRGADCTYAGAPIADDQDVLLEATTDRGAYNSATTYAAGDYAYILINTIRQYYVSLINSNTQPLTDAGAWARDLCAKRINSCRLRFGGVIVTSTRTMVSFAHYSHGTGYTVGDVLTAIGGTFTVPVSLQVDALGSGDPPDHVASFANGGFHILNNGTYTVVPPNPVYFSGGTGTGFAMLLGWTTVVGGTAGVLPTGAFPGAAKVAG